MLKTRELNSFARILTTTVAFWRLPGNREDFIILVWLKLVEFDSRTRAASLVDMGSHPNP